MNVLDFSVVVEVDDPKREKDPRAVVSIDAARVGISSGMSANEIVARIEQLFPDEKIFALRLVETTTIPLK